MPTYEIIAKGDAVERYAVEAESEADARECFERGEAGEPWSTEVSGSEIESIEEES